MSMTNSVIKGDLFKADYLIGDRRVPASVVADYEAKTLKIMSRGYSQTFDMDEYETYHGDMEMYVTKKLGEAKLL